MNSCGGEHIEPEEERVVKAAVRWFRMHKPLSMSHRDHLDSPKINTGGHEDGALAVAVAEYLKSLNKES